MRPAQIVDKVAGRRLTAVKSFFQTTLEGGNMYYLMLSLTIVVALVMILGLINSMAMYQYIAVVGSEKHLQIENFNTIREGT